MPMSPRLLRPVTSGFHPEAQVWRNAVIANGGSVSATTLKAVSDFCRAIDAAGIRSLLFRVNLFCGTGLEACLVPLYRGPSRTGTQFGNATDTNANFVSGDYTETGTSGGLGTGAGNTTKYLDTGFAPVSAGLVETDSHMSYYSRAGNTSSGSVLAVGAFSANTQHWQWFLSGTSGSIPQYYRSGGASNSGIEGQGALRTGHMIAKRDSDGGAMYRNGSGLGLPSNVTGSMAWSASWPKGVFVYGMRWVNGSTNTESLIQQISMTLQAYSLGRAFTDAQALAYYNAMEAFQTALGRQL